MHCTACATEVPDEDLFCENCGEKLSQPEGPIERCACGAPASEADEEGFCQACGRRVRRPASDHIEQVISPECAAVSDRGLRHEHNEDRFALVAADDCWGLVVCDGVSATRNPEAASSAVAETVGSFLERGLMARQEQELDAEALLREAISAAVSELTARTGEDGEGSPSTTLVAALVCGDEVTVAWVGDSRAYWITAEQSLPLTRDHSWLNRAVDSGELTRAEAERMPLAHAITRWIGADAGEAAEPELVRHGLTEPGTLLLCSDGLWNYLQDPETLGAAVRTHSDGEAEALHVAQALVAFANDQGGQDNVTVALLQRRPAARAAGADSTE